MEKIKYSFYCYLKSLNQDELEHLMRFVTNEFIYVYEKDLTKFVGKNKRLLVM